MGRLARSHTHLGQDCIEGSSKFHASLHIVARWTVDRVTAKTLGAAPAPRERGALGLQAANSPPTFGAKATKGHEQGIELGIDPGPRYDVAANTAPADVAQETMMYCRYPSILQSIIYVYSAAPSRTDTQQSSSRLISSDLIFTWWAAAEVTVRMAASRCQDAHILPSRRAVAARLMGTFEQGKKMRASGQGSPSCRPLRELPGIPGPGG